MSTSAHSDPPAFSVPCKHCAALLHPQERICPFCSYDQGAPTEEVDGLHALSEFESPDTLPPLDDDQTLIMPRRTRQKAAAGRAVVAAPAAPIALRAGRPAYTAPDTLWQKEEPARSRPMRWIGGLAVSLVAAMVLFALTLALDYFYFDKRTEPGKARAFQSDIAQVRAALGRGDLSAAERTLDSLDADYSDNPTLQPLREELDRRLQEQETRREQLRDAAKRASQALGVPEPREPPTAGATTPAQVPAPATPVATTPPSAAPAAARRSAPAQAKDAQCNEALAALSLCSTEARKAP
ncbi:hypothetical protein [Variovorax sp. YR216]|uniref:hypothetical protein n=1 Tax=Variovorax sp. YR216 TaxID=1882828 RepID=UPI000899F7DE|nr:hypothetical protein [Variovorax sp. YR216]SEB25716.1 hypothetical protein SAMN05444680_1273 [Variovorax sp. YR216]